MATSLSPARAVLDLLAPSRCLACRRRSPLPWCPACAALVQRLAGGCPRCAAPRGRGHPCWPLAAPIASTVAVYDYRGPVAAAIVTAKLRGAWAGWRPFADALADAVAVAGPDADVVTWITTPQRRARRRDGDHAGRLATAVARVMDLPLARLLEVDAAPPHPDRYLPRSSLPGTNVLLVDDVVTTGATAVRAASALRDAGADAIHLAVVARAGSHALTGADDRRQSSGTTA